MQNRTSLKVWLFLGSLSVGLLVAGEKVGHRHGLLAGFLLALLMNALIFFYGELCLLRRFSIERLEGQDPWGLLSSLETLCRKAGIPVPRLFLADVATPTSLSVGMSSNSHAILLAHSISQEFTPTEVEAILAFEVARLKRHDTLASTAAAAMTGGLSTLARLLDQVLFLQFLRRSAKGCQFRPTSFLFSPLIGLLARVAIGQKNYFESDALAASLIEDPQRMARVLWKLHSFQTTRPIDVAPSDTPLFIVNPLTSCGWYRYFQVQPTIERRIRRLIGHYPI